MRLTYITLSIVLFGAFSLQTAAQTGKIKKADKKFDHLAYAEAIINYEKIAQKGDSSLVAQHLGSSYFEVRNMEKAEEWFGIASKTENADPSSLYFYAESLKANGKYSEAMLAMEAYNNLNASDSRAKNMLEHPDYLAELLANPDMYTLTNLDCNTKTSDFGPSLYGDTLYFVSSRNEGVSVKRNFSWNNAPFLDLFTAEVSGTNTANVKSAGTHINTPMHEGPACFSADGQRMFFTRNNHLNGKTKKTSDDLVNLKIYIAQRSNASWSSIEEFTWNSDEYSVGHPSLSADGKTLYFASDMPGGKGASDLYTCTLQEDGTWSKPKNMGDKINTEGNEMFPFIDTDGILYFSSDGHLGLGGLDIIQVNSKAIEQVVNMGAPLNSSSDDFSLVMGEDHLSGYVSSNRPGGKGDDDIYAFTINEIPTLVMLGKVIDESTGLALANAQVKLMDKDGKFIGEGSSDPEGNFNFDLTPGACGYMVLVSNGSTWDTYTSEASSCDVRKGEVDLGPLPLTPLGWSAVGTIREKGTLAPQEGFLVTLTNEKTGEVQSATTAADGSVDFPLEAETDYSIRFEKKGFFAKNGMFTTVNMMPGVLEINKYVDLEFEAIEIGKAIKIENIYYDYDKSFIRADAAKELDKIVALLLENPSIKIEMGSHTDARGSDSYNLKLSDRRAKAAMEYLVKKGIARNRVTYKGYGETVLINDCANGTECSDEKHEENRRTEFKVIGFL
jgi:outer membrane protein OmpA-like peptidoglycan-associated protein/Tol biopolymer transport system component